MKPVHWLFVLVSHLGAYRCCSFDNRKGRARPFRLRRQEPSWLPSPRASTSLSRRRANAAVDEATHAPENKENPNSSDSDSSPRRGRFLIQACNMTSPRAWLEAHEDGAYTVLRCDYCPSASASTPPSPGSSWSSMSLARNWRVWGLDFHMNRLCESYLLLLQSGETGGSAAAPMASASASDLDVARKITLAMIEAQLLCRSDPDKILAAAEKNQDGSVSTSEATLMLVILWQPRITATTVEGDSRSAPPAIDVRGCATNVATSSPPIHAVLALANPAGSVRDKDFDFAPLPSRLPFPSAKLSRWCRDRCPLEDRFQIGDGTGRASEIILCSPGSPPPPDGGWTDHSGVAVPFVPHQTTELWEGLTTNLFVLYRDGVLRTAPTDRVLGGYVRHLVIQAAARGIVSVEERAPLLEESDRWEEVFVTSSVRLIVPVESVSVVSDGARVPVWTRKPSDRAARADENGSGCVDDGDRDSLWKKIYNVLLDSLSDSVVPLQ